MTKEQRSCCMASIHGQNWQTWGTIWECQLKLKVKEQTLQSLEYALNQIIIEDRKVKRYKLPEEKTMMAAET